MNAKTEPTDRSNSPETISSPTPMATSAVSGKKPRKPRRLPADRKMPSDLIWKIITRIASISSAASSGFSR